MRDGRDVSEFELHTKIRAKYLRALENEEWGLLPAPTFTKGFLRIYAEALGLDWRALVEEYKREWEQPNELDVVPVRPNIGVAGRDRSGRLGLRLGAPVPARRGGSAAGRRRLALLAGALAVIAGVVVLVIVLISSGSHSSARDHSLPVAGGGAGHRGSATAACTSDAGGAVVDGCVALRIEPTAPVFVCLAGSGSATPILRRTLSPLSVPVTYRAHRFVVTLSNTSPKLVIDGRVEHVATAPQPVSYSVTVNGLTELASPHGVTC
jgi:hypothetical protein